MEAQMHSFRHSSVNENTDSIEKYENIFFKILPISNLETLNSLEEALQTEEKMCLLV